MFQGLPFFVVFTVMGHFPAAIVLGIYYLLRRRRSEAPARVLHWSDALSVLLPFWVWVVLVWHTRVGDSKSLSNLGEILWCGWGFSALLALRAAVALRQRRLRADLWGYITLAAVLLSIVLLALLVPALPE